jgi:hypothetical protein
VATVRTIEPWKDTGKFVLEFSATPKEIPPIPLVKGGSVLCFQNMRYAKFNRLTAGEEPG